MYLKSPYPDLPIEPAVNVHDFLWNRSDQDGWPEDFVSYIDAKTGEKRRYREFRERVRLAATVLAGPVSQGGLEIHAGEAIGIISPNSLDYVTLVLSLLAVHAPFVLISPYWTEYELTHALQLTRPSRFFVHAGLICSMLPIAKRMNISLDTIYVLDGNAGDRKSLETMINEARSREIPFDNPCSVPRDTLAYLVFSSGTSGLPKAVMVSHGNLLSSLMQAETYGEIAAELSTPPPELNTPQGIPIHLAVLPMYHSYGLHVYCLRAFLTPATYVVFDHWKLESALQAIPRYKITHFALVPSLLHQLVNYPRLKEFNLSSLQMLGCGGAYLPPELAAKLPGVLPRVDFMDGFGMSEVTIGAIVPPPPGALNGKLKHVPGSLGVLLPGMEARVLREDGSEAEVNEVGELYLKGGNIVLGYWANEKATRETFVNGWLRTGDRFRVNEDGYLFYADRAKDILKVSGHQVSPTEIEDALLSEPRNLITDVSVAGVSGARMTDERVPRAWIVLSDAGRALGVGLTIRALERWHQEQLSKYKWLRGGIEVVDEIPKSPTGKVLRRVLQERYETKIARTVKGKL